MQNSTGNTRLSPQEIEGLPTIQELIETIQKEEREWLESCSNWRNSLPLIASIDCPYISYRNEEDDDKFIVNRLQSGRFSLKPNLRKHRYLYRGQNRDFGAITSSFFRQRTFEDKLLSNLRYQEFVILLRSHPLFMMFERGVMLDHGELPFVFEMNYYGLAQHYGFNTGLVDFTSDIGVAAFFATTEYNNGVYSPIEGSVEGRYGVLYTHKIVPTSTFWAFQFRSIGQQVYPRSGRQKGFVWQESRDENRVGISSHVEPHRFRHDAKCSREIFERYQRGQTLFPKDDIAGLAEEILHSDTISGVAFAENLRINPGDDPRKNLGFTLDAVNIDWNREIIFLPDMLDGFFRDVKNGIWEEFCSPIVFVGSKGNKWKEELLRLPDNPYYRQCFDKECFEKMSYYMRKGIADYREKSKCFIERLL